MVHESTLPSVYFRRSFGRALGAIISSTVLCLWLAAASYGESKPMLVADLHPGAEATASLPNGRVMALGSQLLLGGSSLREVDPLGGEVSIVSTVAARDLVPSPVPGQLLFRGGPDDTLWRTDGTEGETVEVSSVVVYGGFLPAGGLVFFNGESAAHGEELWQTDGTTGGTVRLTDLVAGSGSSSPELLDALFTPEGDPIVFFAASSDSHGAPEPWRYSTDDQSLAIVDDIHVGSGGSYPTCQRPVYGIACPKISNQSGPILVSAETPDEGEELWGLDLSGATLVLDINPGTDSSSPQEFARLDDGGGGQFVFIAETADEGEELWVTDGTPGGTELVLDLLPGPDGSAYDTQSLGAAVLFAAEGPAPSDGYELWITDGSGGGTSQLLDLLPGPESSDPYFIGELDGMALISADSGLPRGGSVSELWISDGTVPGTIPLGELAAEDGDPVPLGAANYFWAWSSGEGGEIWSTDGTPGGTSQLTSYAARNESDLSISLQHQSDRVVFAAGPTDPQGNERVELWVTDGTIEGTEMLAEYGDTPQVLGEALGLTFGWATTNATGMELLVTDGTPGGTGLIDIFPGTWSSQPSRVIEFNGLGYFSARPSTAVGQELFVTDGTAAGTMMLVDLHPASGVSSSPGCFTKFKGELYFCSFDKLWKTDGTVPGTVMVADGNPGGPWLLNYFTPFQNAAMEELMIFIGRHPTLGDELWVTDGTEVGTQVVRDVNPSGDSVNRSSPPVVWNGRVYLLLDNGTNGFEPWYSDGTELGTQMLKDVRPGVDPSYASTFIGTPNGLLFTAYEETHGNEPWVSDGTELGTEVLLDIAPGAASSSPSLFDARGFDGRVWIRADPLSDQQGGRTYELWSTDGTAGGTQFELVFFPEREGDPINPSLATDGSLLYMQLDTPDYGRSLYAVCAECDYGDASELPYPTTTAMVGARHRLGALFLGAQVDSEADGQPSGDTEGDDDFDLDDEDGVELPLWLNPGYTSPVVVTSSAAGRLDAWIDLDEDGLWEEGDERIFQDLALAPGTQSLDWSVPASFPFGASPHVLRFRLSSAGDLSPIGHAVDGEVEDHELVFQNAGPIFIDGFESGDASLWN